jgi:putative peptidoglycan lipid II flippase
VAFVGVLVVAARGSGFSLRPRLARHDPEVRALVRHSGWGVLLHAIAGALLGAAIILGNAVEGGVVAYQVGFVFFLAPYATLAQPVHTTILPELALEARRTDRRPFAGSLRWALDSIAVLIVPVSAALVALALPIMRVVAFGGLADNNGVPLLAAALASLAAGLYGYSAFLLLARAYYALGDSRTPAIVAVLAAVVGVTTMFAFAPFTHGAARVALLGAGHSVAYLVGAIVLWVGVGRRIGSYVVPHRLLRATILSVALATGAWFAMRALDPQSRVATFAALAVIGAVGGGLYVLTMRMLHDPVRATRSRPHDGDAAEAEDGREMSLP